MRKGPGSNTHKKHQNQPGGDEQRYNSRESSSRKHRVTNQFNENDEDVPSEEVLIIHGSQQRKHDSTYWDSSRGRKGSKEKNHMKIIDNGHDCFNDMNQESALNDENDYLCSECRTSKIDGHLMTLKKLREKALRYTNQLDDIRTATKKREKELVDVMERLQLEEKNLHEQLENVDQLSFKMNMKRNQLRQDQMSLQQEESEMAQRLQALKEKEIFVNCQMVKLQSQEAAIKHRKRELHKEKLRIEKLAYLIFKTDLSTMTYREFHTRMGKMQTQLEKRYRKLKVMEHYCQHKTLPVGMKLEPITPIEQSMDPAVAAFEDVLWGNKSKERIASNASIRLFNMKNSCCQSHAKHAKTRAKMEKMEEQKTQSKKSVLMKYMVQETAIPKKERSSATTTLGFKSDSSFGSKLSTTFRTVSKKSKSEQRQECQIVKQEVQNLQRLVMSARETTASVNRLLQTPLPEIDGDPDQIPVERISSHHTRSSQSNIEEDYIPEDYDQEEEVQVDGNDSADSFISDVQEDLQGASSHSDMEQEIEDETEEIHRRISELEDRIEHNSGDTVVVEKDPDLPELVSKSSQFVTAKNSNGGDQADENGICSIFRNAKNDEEKISSQSLIHPEPHEYTVPFKYNWRKSSEESVNDLQDEISRRKRSTNSGEKRVRSTKRAVVKSGNEGDRIDYDDMVNDRLARLSETTRNEIVYALGQKALAQVAEAMDRAANRNPPSRHGDQSSRIQQGDVSKEPSKNSDIVSRSHNHDSYLQTVRRGMKSAGKKGPRRIPSHLKFGNFNIRHRGRKSMETYRQGSQVPPHSYEKYRLQPQDSESQTKPVADCSSQDIENAAECNFHEENYSAEVIAEKILGIHTLTNSSRRRAPNKVAPKLSHTRAFRV